MTTDPADVPKIITVGEGFQVRQAIDNIVWIDMGEYAIVVDALEEAHLADEVFAAIASALGDTPVRYLLNTHTHYDHVALNSAFRRRYGTEIIDQANTPAPPEGRWFEGSRRRLQWIPMTGCHTAEDCVAWVPDDRALLVGDIFGYGLIPLTVNLREDSARLLVETYNRLIEFDADVVIPGHGPLCTTATLTRWVEYFHWLRERIGELVAAGAKDKKILAEMAPPEDMKSWWRFLKWKHEDSVSKVLKSIRRGRL